MRGRGVHDRDVRALRGDRESRARASTTRSDHGRVLRRHSEGPGRRPWPPNYRKAGGRRRPGVRRAKDYDTPEAEAEREEEPCGDGEAVRRAERKRRAAAKAAGAPEPATRPTPTGRRRSSVPVIEISRAKSKFEALEGLERWKARHPAAAAALQEPDVLVDGMRGRSSLWYRVRVNLRNVPEGERPSQEALEVDYDPWEGMDVEAWRREEQQRRKEP